MQSYGVRLNGEKRKRLLVRAADDATEAALDPKRSARQSAGGSRLLDLRKILGALDHTEFARSKQQKYFHEEFIKATIRAIY